MMFWNIILSLVVAPVASAFTRMFQEVKRLQIILNKTNAESLNTSNNGVIIGNKRLDVGNLGDTNTSGADYVAYLWKAGGNKGKYNYEGQGFTTAEEMLAVTGVDVTDGYITPTGC